MTIDTLYGPQLNNSGRITFRSLLAGSGVDGTNNGAIYSVAGGVFELIAREGDQAPGVAAGVTFEDLGQNPVLNESGQVAFVGDLTGPGVNNSNNFGLFATRTNGVLELIVRKGDLFDVDPSPLVTDNRLITAIDFVNVPDGSGFINASLNDAGQLIFKLTFFDNTTGVFIANIPEPASLALLATVGLPLISRRRWRTYRCSP